MTIVSRISLIGHSAAAREMERSVATAVATAAKRAIATEVTAGTEEILGLPHESTSAPSTSSPPTSSESPEPSESKSGSESESESGSASGSEPGSESALSAIEHIVEAARDAAQHAAAKAVSAATDDEDEGGTPTTPLHVLTVLAQRSTTDGDLGSPTEAHGRASQPTTHRSGTSHGHADDLGAGHTASGSAKSAGSARSAHAAESRPSTESLHSTGSAKSAGLAPTTESRSSAESLRSTGSVQATSHRTAVEHVAEADAAAVEVQTVAQAASVPVMPASPWAILVGFGIVGLGALIAWQMPHAKPIEIGSAMATYGALLVFATAVERLLEPISHWMPGRKARENYEASVVKVINGHPEASLNEVAAAHSAVTRAAADRTVLVWGLATAISTVAATATGFYLLRMISAADWHATVPTWVDGFITGLVVGSGTKPLHDLISRAQGSKDPTPPASA